MEQLIKQIKKGWKINVDGENFAVLGKSLYIPVKYPTTVFAEIRLSRSHILHIEPRFNRLYVGMQVEEVAEFNGMFDEAEFFGKRYHLVNHDYQLVKELVFGEPLESQGEAEYWYYEGENTLEVVCARVDSHSRERIDILVHRVPLEYIRVFK